MGKEELTVEEFMDWANEIIAFICKRKDTHSINRIRVTAAAFGRIMGATATDRAALDRGIQDFLDLAKEGAYLYMGQRERGDVPNS